MRKVLPKNHELRKYTDISYQLKTLNKSFRGPYDIHVLDIDTNKELNCFENATEAGEWVCSQGRSNSKYCSTYISKSYLKIRGKHSIAYGYKWKFTKKKVTGGNDVINALRHYKLLGTTSSTKFIPKNYLYNSYDIRLELLQGLMDTDGYIDKKGLSQYTSVSKKLIDDVKTLIQSLGGTAKLNIETNRHYTDYGGRYKPCKDAYTLIMKMPNNVEYCKLSRKKNNINMNKKYKPIRLINDITYIGIEECQCIQSDSKDHLYLTDEYIVTHNTKSSCDIAVAYKHLFKHCLVVCGVNGLKYNWIEEIHIHTEEKAHVIGSRINTKHRMVEGGSKERIDDLKQSHDEYFLIINVEAFRNKEIVQILADKCKSGEIGFVILDEAHKICNPSSLQTKGFLKLNSQFKISMSGTPLMNKPLDLFVTLKWLNVENHSFYAFKNHYCTFGGYGGYEIIGFKNMNELQEKLNSVMLRRLKVDVLDLPEKICTTEYVEMETIQSRIYKDILNAIKSDIMTIKANPNPLAQLIRLRQATGFTGVVSTTNVSAKMDRLIELVNEKIANKEKVIVFSNWTSMTDVIQEKLIQYNPAIITGKVKDRMEQVNKFQTNDSCKVFIGTIGAAGTGLTLTAASTVIFIDEPWSASIKAQASDRAHRIGQKKTVNIITIIAKDTIDERVQQIVLNKGMMADALIDGKVDRMNKEKMVDFLLS